MRFFVVLLALGLASCGATAEPSCNGSLEAISVVEWSAEAADRGKTRLSVSVRNNLQKPVRMVDADVGFIDALGKEVVLAEIERDIEIPAGGTHSSTKDFPSYSSGGLARLPKLRQGEVTAYACTRAVLYDDGTKQSFER